MKAKNVSKQILLISTLFGFVAFAVFLLYFIPKDSTHGSSILPVENAAALLDQKQEDVGLPVRIKIPVIGVDTNVIPVGLTPDGAMGVPKGPTEVAWFNLGFRPGENGTAVVAGHYGWKNDTPAVFDNLGKLEVGDTILVEDEGGKTSSFIVRETRIYDKDVIASEVFSSSDGKGHLNLITCTGDWNKEEDSFYERLVVFTDKE